MSEHGEAAGLGDPADPRLDPVGRYLFKDATGSAYQVVVVLRCAGDVAGALLAVDPMDPTERADTDKVVKGPEDGRPPYTSRNELSNDVLSRERPVPAKRGGDDRAPRIGAPEAAAFEAIEDRGQRGRRAGSSH